MNLQKKCFGILICLILSCMIIFPSLADTSGCLPGAGIVTRPEDLKNIQCNDYDYVTVSGIIEIPSNMILTLRCEHIASLVPVIRPGNKIVIRNGGTLIVDAPLLDLSGDGNRYSLIEVEKGGTLILKRGLLSSLNAACTYPTVIVEPGGKCRIESDFKISDRNNHNISNLLKGDVLILPGNHKPDPPSPENGIGPEEVPGVPPEPANIGAEIALVNEYQTAEIFITVPSFSNSLDRMSIQQSDGENWSDVLSYQRDQEMENSIRFITPDDSESTWNISERRVSILPYCHRLTKQNLGSELTLRIAYFYRKHTTYSDPVTILLPSSDVQTGWLIDPSVYHITNGTRGGGSQGAGPDKDELPAPDSHTDYPPMMEDPVSHDNGSSSSAEEHTPDPQPIYTINPTTAPAIEETSSMPQETETETVLEPTEEASPTELTESVSEPATAEIQEETVPPEESSGPEAFADTKDRHSLICLAGAFSMTIIIVGVSAWITEIFLKKKHRSSGHKNH